MPTLVILLPAVVLVLIALTMGVCALWASDTRIAAFAEAVSHLAAVVLVTVGGLWCIPQFKKIFADFDSELPSMTESVIRASDTLVQYWFLVVPALLCLLAMDVCVFVVLHIGVSTRVLARLWSAVITGLVGCTFLVSVAAIVVPLLKLVNDLS